MNNTRSINNQQNFKNNKKGGNFNRNQNNRMSKEEYEAKKAEKISKQATELDAIAAAAFYLNNLLETKNIHRGVNTRQLIDYLSGEAFNIDSETLKHVSQYTSILIELANACNNTRISEDRLVLRVDYFRERLLTAYRHELQDKIYEILNSYPYLFGMNATEEEESTTNCAAPDEEF